MAQREAREFLILGASYLNIVDYTLESSSVLFILSIHYEVLYQVLWILRTNTIKENTLMNVCWVVP